MITKTAFINEYCRLLAQVSWAISSPARLQQLIDNCFETLHGSDDSWAWQTPFAIQAARNLGIRNYSLITLRELPGGPITNTARKQAYKKAKLNNPMTPDERLRCYIEIRAKSLAIDIYNQKVSEAIAASINS